MFEAPPPISNDLPIEEDIGNENIERKFSPSKSMGEFSKANKVDKSEIQLDAAIIS